MADMFCVGDRFKTVIPMHTHEDVALKKKLKIIPVSTTVRITEVAFPHVKIALERTKEEEFEVDFGATLGKKLGAKVIADGSTLLITAVGPDESGSLDLLSHWNVENQTRRVQAGDRITKVNGICGDVQRMCAELEQDKVLSLSVQPSGEGWLCGAVLHDPTKRYEKNVPQKEYRALIALVEEGSESKRQGCWRYCVLWLNSTGTQAGGAA